MIKRIKIIQGIGSFINYHPSAQEQAKVEFSKNTIIYANNGHGKSTIASILKSLSENDPSKIIQRKSLKDGKPVAIEQEAVISYTSGESCFKANSWVQSKTSKPKIYVFDQQFISDNLFVHQVEATHKQKIHVLVIGQEGATLHKNLVEAKENEKRLNSLFEEKKKELVYRQKQTGREDFLLISDQEAEQINKNIKIVDSKIEMKTRGEKIRALTNKPPIPLLDWSLRRLSVAYQSTLESIHVEAEFLVKAHFEKHTVDPLKAEPIIREALEQTKETCPFCGRDISQVQTLIDAYKSYFNEAHRQLLQEIEGTKEHFNSWNPNSELLNTKSKYTEFENAVSELKNYTDVENDLPHLDFDKATTDIEDLKNQIQKSLDNKIANLSFVPSSEELISLEKFLENVNSWVERTNSAFKSVEKKFEDQLLSIQDISINDLRDEQSRYNACLNRFSTTEEQWCKEYIDAEKKLQEASEITIKCAQELSDYSKDIFKNYQKDINSTLKDLGADFRVDSFSEKVDKKQKQPYADFQLVINETQVPLTARGDNPEFQNTLSEGEKNTLSFAFFINWLKRQNDLQEAIVVFDDPLSSHDDNRKNLTARAIRDISKKITQTILLTHNKDFLFILTDKLVSPKVITLKKDKAHGSTLVSFNLEKERKLSQHQRIDDLERYLQEDYCSVEDAQEKIRLCIETALQFKYYRHLNEITTLGKMLDRLQELSKLQPDLLKTLRDLNEVSSVPHHGEREKTPLKELTRDELLPDIRKTIEVLEAI